MARPLLTACHLRDFRTFRDEIFLRIPNRNQRKSLNAVLHVIKNFLFLEKLVIVKICNKQHKTTFFSQQLRPSKNKGRNHSDRETPRSKRGERRFLFRACLPESSPADMKIFACAYIISWFVSPRPMERSHTPYTV
jgi:hypothetical protein